jgi:hypothetical protein
VLGGLVPEVEVDVVGGSPRRHGHVDACRFSCLPTTVWQESAVLPRAKWIVIA